MENTNNSYTNNTNFVVKEEERSRTELMENKFPTAVLRSIGAIIVVIASIVFLFQGTGIAGMENSTTRHWIFLGITALFGGLTWFLGAVVKENKGARTAIALAVATIPVLFAQMAGMLYDLLGKTDLFGNGKKELVEGAIDAIKMDSVSPGTFAIISVATLLVTLPIAYLGNRILARKQMTPLTILLMVGNGLLLLPFRSNIVIISVILVAATVGLLTYVVKVYKTDTTMRTKEGLLAILNLFIPIVIIALRTLFLYESGQTPLFVGLLLALSGLAAAIIPMSFKNSPVGTFSQCSGAILVALGWFVAFFDVNIEGVSNLKFYIQGLPLGLLVYGISFMLQKSQAIMLRRVALVIFVMMLLVGQVINLDTVLINPIPSLITLLGSLGLILMATKMKEKTPMILSIITISSSILGLSAITVSALSASYSWVLLMFAGIIVIICGSLTEVFNKKWKGQIVEFKNEITHWQ